MPRQLEATTPEDFAHTDAEQVKVDLLCDGLGELVDGREDKAAERLSRLVDRHLDLDACPSDLS